MVKQMKKFIITIDTEGDNLWNWKDGDEITTKNIYSLQRFQDLCNKYNFKPVWLSNWEMLQNDDFVAFIKGSLKSNTCELGMHLHAWNTPPIVPLPKCDMSAAPYLIEYPYEIMEQKIKNITELIQQKFGFMPVSHRAGRWAMNDTYFKLLAKYGYKVDCSYIPGFNLKQCKGQSPNSEGPDYRKVSHNPQYINGILEVPVTVQFTHKIFLNKPIVLENELKAFIHAIKGQKIWIRPNGHNLKEMLWLIDICSKSESDYLMFMIHSSELMAGGSPTFATNESIEILYNHMNIIFEKISKNYIGCMLKEYSSNI